MEREIAVARCSYCQTTILDPAHAVCDREGFPLDADCAAELGRAGELGEVQLPVVRAGIAVGYLPAFWSETLDGFVTVPED